MNKRYKFLTLFSFIFILNPGGGTSVADSSNSSSDDEEEPPEEDDEENMDEDYLEEDIKRLVDVENMIKKMKLEWAKADGEDAAFIEGKIRDMEEFLSEAKAGLGIDQDTDMQDAAKTKKRGRDDVIDDDADADDSGNGGFLGRFKRK